MVALSRIIISINILSKQSRRTQALKMIVKEVKKQVQKRISKKSSRFLGDYTKQLTKFQVVVEFTRNNGHGRVQTECLHEATLEIFHLQGILESHGSVAVAEDLVEFLDDLLLDVRVAAHHRQEEAGRGGRCIVSLI